jgi:hypothetical protein
MKGLRAPSLAQPYPIDLSLLRIEAVEKERIALQMAPYLIGPDAMPSAVLSRRKEEVG